MTSSCQYPRCCFEQHIRPSRWQVPLPASWACIRDGSKPDAGLKRQPASSNLKKPAEPKESRQRDEDFQMRNCLRKCWGNSLRTSPVHGRPYDAPTRSQMIPFRAATLPRSSLARFDKQQPSCQCGPHPACNARIFSYPDGRAES